MIEERKFIVPGEPRPKGRPKFSKRGKYAVAYTDAKTVCYENLVALSYLQANPGKKPFQKGVVVRLTAYFQLPKKYYWPVNKKHHGELRPEGVAKLKEGAWECPKDTDNLSKSCLDGLNHAGAWNDDKQAYHVDSDKQWCDGNPRLEVTLSGEVEDP